MSQAIFGLIGVVVGALMTGGVEFLMERRRERKAVRRSTRLVAEELYILWMQTTLLAELGTVPTGITESRFLSTTTWIAHREVLADALSDDDWGVLPVIFQNAESLRGIVGDMSQGDRIGTELMQTTGEEAHVIAAMYERLTGAPPDRPPDRGTESA